MTPFLPIGSNKFKPSEYAYSDSKVRVKSWNGGFIEIQIGYVKKHPDDLDIRLIKQWKSKDGDKYQIFNIKPDDWIDIKSKIEKLVPDLAKTLSKDDIDTAIHKVTSETKLLELIARYPELIQKTKDVDILLLPREQKEALIRLLTVGGNLANSIIEKLSKEDVTDLKKFVQLLEQMKLSTINSLVTHITSRIAFIDLFEKRIHDDSSFEIKGENSIHNFLKQNIWIVNRSYSILHDNTTLKTIIYKNWGETTLGKEGKERPDFLCMEGPDEDSNNQNPLVIIEIKRPSIKLTMKHVTQLMEYKTLLQRYSGKQFRRFECFLIGRELEELLQQNNLVNSGFVTKTYTDFIEEARKFYKNYMEIIEKENFAF